MSIKTGVARLAQVIKWFGVIVLISMAALDVAASYKLFGLTGGGGIIATTFGVIVFAVYRAIAWVLEGFAKN
jgi:hypothetical protein